MSKVVQLKERWQQVGTHQSELGEGPVWDAVNNKIWWVDILQGDVHAYLPESGEQQTMNLGQKVGAIALYNSGRMIAAMKEGIATVDLTSREIKFISHPEAHLPDNRFNDGKCDPAGRFWAGTMSEVAGVRQAGALYTVGNDYAITTKISKVSCSNGLAWNQEKNTFYFIDTPTRKVVAYDYQPESAQISNKRTVINVSEDQGLPDGMTIDTEGMLWIAHWGGWKVSRWNPFTGARLMDVILPVQRITSCIFGGPDLQDLYITSAKTGLDNVQLENQPLAGSLFVVRNIGYTGFAAHEFKAAF